MRGPLTRSPEMVRVPAAASPAPSPRWEPPGARAPCAVAGLEQLLQPRGPVASAHWEPAVTLPWPGPSFPAAPRCGRTAVSWGCCLGCWLFGLGGPHGHRPPRAFLQPPRPSLSLARLCLCPAVCVAILCSVSEALSVGVSAVNGSSFRSASDFLNTSPP